MELMIILFFVSLLIVVLGTIVKPMQNISLTEPLAAMMIGFIVGPELLNIVEIESSSQFSVLKIAAEFTIAMALMATALRIPSDFYRKNFLTQTNIVVVGMVLMWLASSCILYFLLGTFSFSECLLLGAIITPTDPVVASTIVTGEKAREYLPSSIRNTLSFESGINDGLAYPLVVLAVYLVQTPDFPLQEWVTSIVLYENILSIILAYTTGYIAGIAMDTAHKKGFMNTKSVLSFSIGLAFLLLSGLNILNMNGIIGVFIGGLAYAAHISENDDIQEERVQEAMERLFTIPVFFIFGLMLPWNVWFSMGWNAIAIVLLILLLRRIPVFLILKPVLPQFKGKIYDILTIGWFGPIGVAALYFAMDSHEKTGLEDVWIITSLVVFGSTIVHGVMSVPYEKWYHNK